MTLCFECGSGNNIVHHHIVPRSKGGTKTLPLCQECHDKVHGLDPRNISISQLSRAGIERARSRGVKLGNPNPGPSFAKAVATNKKKKAKFCISVLPQIQIIQNGGITTLQGIADSLNSRSVLTSRGKTWTATAVRRVIKQSV